MVYEHTQHIQTDFLASPELCQKGSPECSRDGMFKFEAAEAAEIQREAVVVSRGGDGHFGS